MQFKGFGQTADLTILFGGIYHCEGSGCFFWAIIEKQSPVSFVSSKHARIMFHQPETINSNAHAILNEAFLKYFYYNSSGHESTKSMCFFSLVEAKKCCINSCIHHKQGQEISSNRHEIGYFVCHRLSCLFLGVRLNRYSNVFSDNAPAITFFVADY